MSSDDIVVRTDPAPDGGGEKAEKPAKAKAAPNRGKWRRRLGRTIITLFVLVVLFRVALAVLLPTVIHKTARQLGFDAEYRRLDLNLIGTQAAIWDLVLRPKDSRAQVLHTDYAFANISS